jgi:tRNA/rRNA methyltransferase
VVATSGRLEREELPLSTPTAALTWLLSDAHRPAEHQAALVFGREDRGLSNQELLQAGQLVRLPTSSRYASLNLSHAVAICLYELQRLRDGAAEESVSMPPPPAAEAPCPRSDLEAALADAEALLLDVGFLYPHTAQARMAKLRALLQRAQVQDQELALLRGMVRQLRWAASRQTP